MFVTVIVVTSLLIALTVFLVAAVSSDRKRPEGVSWWSNLTHAAKHPPAHFVDEAPQDVSFYEIFDSVAERGEAYVSVTELQDTITRAGRTAVEQAAGVLPVRNRN